ncbi:MAG: hypothetical protein ACR2OY_04765, partial [Boseongicola sp.]
DLDLDLALENKQSSRPIGKRKKWQLDTGQFADETLDPGALAGEVSIDAYSGFRLRLPNRHP